MYKPWTRENTKDYIHNVESRLEDICYYLDRTKEWCEKNGVWEHKKILICQLVTCIWVSSMRDEPISLTEITEIVGLDILEDTSEDKIYEICQEFKLLDHEQVLELLITQSSGWGDNYLLS